MRPEHARFSERMPRRVGARQAVPRVPSALAASFRRMTDAERAAAAAELRRSPMPMFSPCEDGWTTATWVHDDPLASAVILSPNSFFDHLDVGASEFERLTDDGLWTISLRVPSDWRSSYVITPHHGGGEPPWRAETDRRAIRLAALAGAADRANPVVLLSMHDGEVSVAEAPEAPPQPYRVSGRGSGRPLRELRVDDPAAGVTRTVWLHEPPEHDRADAPLVVVYDGQAWARGLGAAEVLDGAVAAGALPPLYAAFVDSIDVETRWDEVGVPGGVNDFLADHLIPMLREQHPVTRDPLRTIVTGASFGGLASLWMLALHPDLVAAAVAQSPSLWRFDMDDVLLSVAGRIRLDIQAGTHEPDMHADAERLHRILSAAGCDVTWSPHVGGHDWACWQGGMIDGLSRVLGRG